MPAREGISLQIPHPFELKETSVLLIRQEVWHAGDSFRVRKKIIFAKHLCQDSNIYSVVILQPFKIF